MSNIIIATITVNDWILMLHLILSLDCLMKIIINL